MKKLFNLLTYTIIFILLTLIFLFYIGVFNPLRNELQEITIENFQNTVSIAEINIENFLQRCIEGTESLSSRTMIKNRLNRYAKNEISLAEIKNYTEHKYIDGAEVLHNIIKAVRISNNERIAEYRCKNSDKIDLIVYQNDELETSIKMKMNEKIVLVNSPIIFGNYKIGQDIAAFNMRKLIDDLNKQNINYTIVKRNDAKNEFKEKSDEIVDYRKILNTDYFVKASIKKDNLNQGLENLLLKIIIGIILIIIILIVIFRIIINKTYKKVIENLNNKIEKITELSETDIMLGINNRTKFMNELENEIKRARRYNIKISLIMFDIDNFKSINDEYGHYMGDEILVKITEIVSDIIRDTDIFARYGGDELILLLPETDLKESSILAERLRKKIEEYSFDKVEKVTCSFGVAEFDKEGGIDNFIKKVDDALYKAKNNGRNRIEKI